MSSDPRCPQCKSENVYQDGEMWVCAECFHEWDANAESAEANDENVQVLDSNGNVLVTGDSVIVIKDLKVKGSTSGVKVGTKVRNIRLIEAVDGHNISCKIDGIGAMYLKSEFVRKA
jgi:protein PhnA